MKSSDDALNDILKCLRLKGAVYFERDFPRQWAMQCGPSPYGQFHMLARGAAEAGGGALDTVALHAGDLMMLPHGDEHWVGSSAAALRKDGLEVVQGCMAGEPVFDGDGYGCTLICGHFEYDDDIPHPFWEALPKVMLLCGENGTNSWLQAATNLLVESTRREGVGSEAVSGRLAEVLFIEIIRQAIHAQAVQPGFLQALADVQINRALRYIHRHVHEEITLEGLAKTVAMSRSSLASRFRELVGVPPMAYATQWRMLKAAELLRDTQQSLAQVADAVGYASEATFSRAFKRELGHYPGEWRNRRRRA